MFACMNICLPKAQEEVITRVMTIVNSDLTMRNYADAHWVESTALEFEPVSRIQPLGRWLLKRFRAKVPKKVSVNTD